MYTHGAEGEVPEGDGNVGQVGGLVGDELLDGVVV